MKKITILWLLIISFQQCNAGNWVNVLDSGGGIQEIENFKGNLLITGLSYEVKRENQVFYGGKIDRYNPELDEWSVFFVDSVETIVSGNDTTYRSRPTILDISCNDSGCITRDSDCRFMLITESNQRYPHNQNLSSLPYQLSINSKNFCAVIPIYTYREGIPRLIVSKDSLRTWDTIHGPYDSNPLAETKFMKLTDDNQIVFKYEDFDREPKIYRTPDFGETWFIEEIDIEVMIQDIVFVSGEIGWISFADNILIYKTEDGGKNWIKQADTVGVSFKSLNHMDFYNEKYGVAYNTDFGYYTSDGGENWDPILDFEDPFFPQIFNQLVMVDSVTIAALSGGSSVWIYRFETSSMEDMREKSRILLSPNPASPGETITVSVPGSAGVCRVLLLDGFGRTISESEEPATNSKLEFRLPEGLASGIYWLRIECGGEIFVEKFVVLE